MAKTIEDNQDDTSKRRKGRPRKDESSKNNSNINNLDDELGDNNKSDFNNKSNNNIDIESLENDINGGVNFNDDDSVSKSNKNTVNNQDDIYEIPNEDVNLEQDVAIENSSQNLTDVNDDIPDVDFDPLAPPVKKRGYTTGQIEGSGVNNIEGGAASKEIDAEKAKQLEEKIPEPEIKNPTYENLPPKDEKKKNTSGGNDISGGGSKGTGGNDNFEKFDTGDGGVKSDKKDKETINPKLDDLSPAQKRKAAEKAADAILLTYKKFVPKPFKALSSFNMRKLQIMEMKNEIALDTEVFSDGTTIKKYCEEVNQQVEQTFVITDEMVKEIKDPLVDVLLENNLALTPTQRLLMAVGGQVIQMTMTAVGFMQQNKHALSEFKRYHEESKEIQRETVKEAEKRFGGNENNNNNNNNNTESSNDTQPNNTPPKKTPPKNEAKDIPSNKEEENDDIPNSDANEDVPNLEEETTSDIKDVEIQSETINVVEKDPTIDEYLTEENGGITVEVEENTPDEDDIDEDF